LLVLASANYDYSPLQELHGSHLLLQHGMPLQLGAGGHGVGQHFVGQQPPSLGTEEQPAVSPAASTIEPAAIASITFFIIHFPLYY
jgi:hypothetical protein